MRRLLSTLTLLFLISSCVRVPVSPYKFYRPKHAQEDLCVLYENEIHPDKPLSLCEVIEISLQNNLDIRIQQWEDRVQNEAIAAECLSMMPTLSISSELSERNHHTGYSSKPVGGGPTSPPAISSERNTHRIEEDFVWNSLDFGLAYYRAKKERQNLIVQEQRHIRAKQNLILDIFRAYYRAIVASKAQEKAKQLIEKLKKREEMLAHQIQKQLVPEFDALVNRDQLIEMRVRLLAFENEERSALTELKALMGIAPSLPISLAEMSLNPMQTHLPDINKMERTALINRPELLSQDVKIAMSVDDVHAAIWQMYPGISFFGNNYFDGNKYLVFHNWFTLGMRTAWELLNLPAKASKARRSHLQQEVDYRTRLSMSMGVLTQVHLAYINVHETTEQYALAQELLNIKNSVWKEAEKLLSKGKTFPAAVLINEVEALFAEVNVYRAYANIMIALEQLDNALGKPLLLTSSELKCNQRMAEECWDLYQLTWSFDPGEPPQYIKEEWPETEWFDDPY